MKKHLIKLMVGIVFGAVVIASPSFAERHDEKPHGTTTQKIETESTAEAKSQNTGGRHDEHPHGVKKTKTQKTTDAATDKEKTPATTEGSK